MKNNHKLALYISYYFARFDKEALRNLGYKNWNMAFNDISKKLCVNKHSVKNWRDEFDPLFQYRAGWYQRPMISSRIRVAQALQDLDEIHIREIVKDIIENKIVHNSEEEEQLVSIVGSDLSKKSSNKFILRGPTGKAAEEFFIRLFKSKLVPVDGKLIDCRDLGCGYDFKIIKGVNEYYFEIKGLIDNSGGVLFTDKEWRTADMFGDNYYLCIISNISNNPEAIYIKNPTKVLEAKKSIYSTIQINWSICKNEIEKLRT